ncbi:alpha-tocopherol transfer protein-like isoform X2 [Malaya genurostris]|uniref:alpha-tocopherol transfer protein-like isoform X2 n=1 Tax=Malaya genurostris TaxID=325434 RepID=UPI0026F3AB42|nr:alpha-tocopherol transfer protein-like isoform X2 [Malaya genurostris]
MNKVSKSFTYAQRWIDQKDCDDFVRRSDDLFLCRFLNCCDWDVQEAFQRMAKLFKLKHEHPNWFIDRPIANYQELLNRNIKFVLDKRDKNGRRIFVSKMCNIDINVTAATDLAHLDELWCEFMLNDLKTQENGISCLIDMSGLSIKSLGYLTPSNIRVATQKMDLLPVKNMEFYVINSSMFLNAAVAILYPMLSKHIKDRVHFHYSDWDSLHAHLGKEALPAIYGGTHGKDFNYEMLIKQLLDLEEHYDSLLRFGFELKPHVDSTKYTKLFQNIDKMKSGKRKSKSKKEVELVVE